MKYPPLTTHEATYKELRPVLEDIIKDCRDPYEKGSGKDNEPIFEKTKEDREHGLDIATCAEYLIDLGDKMGEKAIVGFIERFMEQHKKHLRKQKRPVAPSLTGHEKLLLHRREPRYNPEHDQLLARRHWFGVMFGHALVGISAGQLAQLLETTPDPNPRQQDNMHTAQQMDEPQQLRPMQQRRMNDREAWGKLVNQVSEKAAKCSDGAADAARFVSALFRETFCIPVFGSMLAPSSFEKAKARMIASEFFSAMLETLELTQEALRKKDACLPGTYYSAIFTR